MVSSRIEGALVRFLILAIDHGWQLEPYDVETPEITAQKTQLRTLLVQLVEARRVDLICEESDPRFASIAQKIAYEYAPRIPWKNICMTSQERLEAGIYQAILARPFEWTEDPPGSGNARTIDHRIPEDGAREQFFARESLAAARAQKAFSILVVCGDMHAEPLAAILAADSFNVETNHDLIERRFWK
jgi:hypothetical protein